VSLHADAVQALAAYAPYDDAQAALHASYLSHCEVGDTTLADVALREATEESGIDELRLLPRPVALDRHPAPCGAESHLDVQYVAVAPRDAVAEASEESLDLCWFPVDALPEPTDHALRRLLARALVVCG
jgi:8-oxo-dGTP pyrophosphatase MutT (NUDIX family)